MRKSKLVCLILLTIWGAAPAYVNRAMGGNCQQDEIQTSSSGISIFQSNGKPAEKATIISINNRKRLQLFNSPADGKFTPQLVDDDLETLPLPTTAPFSQVIDGATLTTADSKGMMPMNAQSFSHLVVSKDRTEAAFVPPGYTGNIQLRPCGKLRLDASNLNANEALIVVVLWKNCLAGRYALCGNKQPGDPENENHDWRFRPFFTVTTYPMIKPEGVKDIYLPPGEVSIAVLTGKQYMALDEFAADNLSEEFKFNMNHIPATSGIHRIFQSKTTTVPLRTGTCVKGKIVSETKNMPNWNDAGFVEASVTVDDFWTSRLDWIPGYDLRKGVNHYYKVLQSDAGLMTRARTLAATKAILKVDGRFFTLPLPQGEYNAHLYRPDLTKKFPADHFADNRGPRTLPIGVPLRFASDELTPDRVAMQHLLNARVAIWQGNLKTARQQLELAEARGAKEALVLESLNETEGLITKHAELVFLRGKSDSDYNRQAAEFLLTQAKGFLNHSDFGRAEQLIKHARSFPVNFSASAGNPDEAQGMLNEARAEILDGSKRVSWHSSSFVIEDNAPEIVDMGELTYSKPTSASSADETKKEKTFNPLTYNRQAPNLANSARAVSQLKKAPNQNSKEFTWAMSRLKSAISTQFDNKMLARDEELSELEEKIRTARENLRRREANRDEIVIRRLKKILLENGIELSKPANKHK